MEKRKEALEDPDFFNNVTNYIEKELSQLKKIVDAISQMRVEAAYLESDLILTMTADTWENVSEFIGLTSMKYLVDDKKDSQ